MKVIDWRTLLHSKLHARTKGVLQYPWIRSDAWPCAVGKAASSTRRRVVAMALTTSRPMFCPRLLVFLLPAPRAGHAGPSNTSVCCSKTQ